MKNTMLTPIAIILLSCITLGCASVSSPADSSSDPASDVSQLFEPPSDWTGGVSFQFVDSTIFPAARLSTRIEFYDGVRIRAITAADYLPASSGVPHTPWYRLRPGRDTSLVDIRVTLTHETGARTTAVYPLPIFKDEFFAVHVGVGTREPTRSGSPPPPLSLRGYALDPAAGSPPSDSLWIFYDARGRYCFDCPR